MDYKDILKAAERLAGVSNITPIIRSPELDHLLNCTVFIKPELLQKSGSFKFRGAYNRLSQLSGAQKKHGVVTYSSGNHAQGVALAAKLLKIKATIIMPKDAPKIKIAKTKSYGAHVILYDRYKENREEIGAHVAQTTGAILVPPYEDEHIIAGQGTAALELMQFLSAQNIALDAFLCPTGGGGLLAGSSIVIKQQSPATKIYAVEPEFFDDYARSLAAGKRVANEDMSRKNICDALMTPMPGALTFSINKNYVERGLSVSEDEVRHAMHFAIDYLNIVVEPGGAVALAALLAGKIETQNKNIGIILSGGNIDTADLMACLKG